MEREINRMVTLFEEGKMTRRQLVSHIGAFAAALAAGGAAGNATANAAPANPTFKATGLDHIALRVTDVPRARDWYAKHLGLEVTSRDSASSSFMNAGSDDWLALFRGDEAEFDHYCYAIEDYDPGEAMERLEAAGLDGERRGNRVYFRDPDGYRVQVTGRD